MEDPNERPTDRGLLVIRGMGISLPFLRNFQRLIMGIMPQKDDCKESRSEILDVPSVH
jgi:hypothetical protein